MEAAEEKLLNSVTSDDVNAVSSIEVSEEEIRVKIPLPREPVKHAQGCARPALLALFWTAAAGLSFFSIHLAFQQGVLRHVGSEVEYASQPQLVLTLLLLSYLAGLICPPVLFVLHQLVTRAFCMTLVLAHIGLSPILYPVTMLIFYLEGLENGQAEWHSLEFKSSAGCSSLWESMYTFLKPALLTPPDLRQCFECPLTTLEWDLVELGYRTDHVLDRRVHTSPWSRDMPCFLSNPLAWCRKLSLISKLCKAAQTGTADWLDSEHRAAAVCRPPRWLPVCACIVDRGHAIRVLRQACLHILGTMTKGLALVFGCFGLMGNSGEGPYALWLDSDDDVWYYSDFVQDVGISLFVILLTGQVFRVILNLVWLADSTHTHTSLGELRMDGTTFCQRLSYYLLEYILFITPCLPPQETATEMLTRSRMVQLSGGAHSGGLAGVGPGGLCALEIQRAMHSTAHPLCAGFIYHTPYNAIEIAIASGNFDGACMFLEPRQLDPDVQVDLFVFAIEAFWVQSVDPEHVDNEASFLRLVDMLLAINCEDQKCGLLYSLTQRIINEASTPGLDDERFWRILAGVVERITVHPELFVQDDMVDACQLMTAAADQIQCESSEHHLRGDCLQMLCAFFASNSASTEAFFKSCPAEFFSGTHDPLHPSFVRLRVCS